VSCGRRESSASEATGDSNEKAQSRAAVSVEDIGTEQRGAGSQVQNLPHYELMIAAADLDALENNPGSNDTHPATFKAGGKVYNGVKVRVRGSWSRTWPKKSFKILFDHGAPFEGQRSINLNSGWRDPAFVREPLAYYVYEVCGVPAPRSRMVRVDVNGRFGGLYVEVEQPGKEFLSRVGLAGASVFKAGSRGRDADERDLGNEEAYRACYSKETQKTDSYTELQQFCHGLDTATDKLDFFTRHVDLDRYVNYLAATALIQSIDGRGITLRTFALDPSARMLVAASQVALPVRDGDAVKMLPAGLSVYRIGADGKLDFARKYDVDLGGKNQFWSGMVALA
jgi:hypothetical protein